MTDELAIHPSEPPVMQAQHGPEGGTPLRRAQRAATESTGIDLDAAQRAAADFLAALGVELDREELGATPARERILRLSKLARLVEHFAARPQTQERLTKQVADCLAERLRSRGTGVVLQAEHSCMTLRGVRALGATTVTSALLGMLRTDARSRAEFFSLARVPG
jgi:GTP cyclohydrolase I